MPNTFRVALLQMQTGNDLAANLDSVKSMTREAARNGAQFVLTPEYTLMMDGLADGGESPGVVYADIDPARVDRARGMLPCLEHDVEFAEPKATATPG